MVRHVGQLLRPLRDQLVDILSLEILFDDLEGLLVNRVAHRLTDAKYHVQHQIPVVMPESDKGLLRILLIQLLLLLFGQRVDMVGDDAGSMQICR